MAGLTSERMRQLVQEARDTFDWVLIDTPPIGLLTDAHLLASMVDGALFVIRANQTPYDMVKRAIDAIGREKILGVVLNGAEAHHHAKYQYYYANYYRPALESGSPR
jgi:Mrp family chromosome partitioning ATPase